MLKIDDSGASALTAAEEVKAVQRLLSEGRAAEAEPRLRALAPANSGHGWFWALLAECYEALGDASAELEASEKALALDPARLRLRMRAALILEERGDLAGAAGHYQILSDAFPDRPKPIQRLARLRQLLGDEAGELAARTRFLAIAPDDLGSHSRLADLHESAGRLAEARPHLAQCAKLLPNKIALWERLARASEAGDDVPAALEAWRRVVELDPRSARAHERIALLEMSGGAPSARARRSVKSVRLLVLGNCQAYAMARCLRVLHPAVEAAAVNWGDIRSEADFGRVLATLTEVDAVVAQPANLPEFKALSPKALIHGQTRAVFFPGVHFTGFQPDAERVIAPGLASLIGEWHSLLIMAGYRMGLPPARTEELFNAYVYGVLGYFDEYAKSSQFLSRAAARIEWDLSTELQAWTAPFVHTPNHPRIEVMMDLARGACARLGLEIEDRAPPPEDPFLVSGAWPIYPEIGKRLGLKGEMTFVAPHQAGRAFPLDEAIAWYYAVYAKAPPTSLAVKRVDEVIAVLKAERI